MSTRTTIVAFTLAVAALCISARAESFTMPIDGRLYMWADGGSAGADTIFGIGTTPDNAQILLVDLPKFDPGNEVLVGTYQAGDEVVFAMYSTFAHLEDWAFSNASDPSSIRAFTDENNSLGWGGSIIEQTSPDTYRLYMDDANSYRFDDDDNDVLVGLRVEIPEPATGLLLLASGGFLALRRR